MKKFSAFMMNNLTEEEQNENGGYLHPTKSATLFISKDGVIIKLTEEEIEQLVRTVGANFNR